MLALCHQSQWVEFLTQKMLSVSVGLFVWCPQNIRCQKDCGDCSKKELYYNRNLEPRNTLIILCCRSSECDTSEKNLGHYFCCPFFDEVPPFSTSLREPALFSAAINISGSKCQPETNDPCVFFRPTLIFFLLIFWTRK